MATAQTEEYLSIAQLAERIPYSEGTIMNMISDGRFIEGYHYKRPTGKIRKNGKRTGRPVFLWSKIQEWIDADGKLPDKVGNHSHA